MKKFSTFFVLILFIVSGFVVKAQDIHFAQYAEAPLLLNPALAGAISGDVRAQTSYRDQWRTAAVPYKTFAISCDAPFFRKKWKSAYLGTGLSVMVDKSGDGSVGTYDYSLSLATGVYLSRGSVLSLGIQGNYTFRNIDYSVFTWDQQYDQAAGAYNAALSSGESFRNTNFSFFDFAAGLAYNFSKGEMYATANDQFKLSLGASYYHIAQPQFSFLGNPENLWGKMVAHGSALIGIKNSIVSVVPSLLYMRQGPNQEITFGSSFRFMLREDSKYTGFVKQAAISVGGLYRFGDAAIITSYLEIANYGIGFSYDFNISDLRTASSFQGGFELSLRYTTPNPFLYSSRPRYDLN